MPAASLLLLAGCVTARLHSEEELAVVGRDCGVALGELFQDKSEKRLLFLFRIQPTTEQRACVTRWARRNHLKTVFVDAINFPES
jgi:ribosomal protein S3AE